MANRKKDNAVSELFQIISDLSNLENLTPNFIYCVRSKGLFLLLDYIADCIIIKMKNQLILEA